MDAREEFIFIARKYVAALHVAVLRDHWEMLRFNMPNNFQSSDAYRELKEELFTDEFKDIANKIRAKKING